MAIDDQRAIAELLRALYECVTFAPGGSPDFDRLGTLFVPGARLVHAQRTGTRIMDLAEFCDLAMAAIESGSLQSFAERELGSDIVVFGHIAQARSTYEATRGPDDDTPLARGVNLVQLLRDAGGWRVVSILWQDEDAEDQLPPEMLPPT